MNIIITGASKGLGKAFARIFAENNNTLLLCARNIIDLEKTSLELKNTVSTIYCKAVDMSKKNEVIDFANWCLAFGVPDIIINNAGSFLPGSIYEEEDGILEKMIGTNIKNMSLFFFYHLW